MAVYVDSAKNAFGNMKMCHMIADTLEELHEMATKLGLRNYFQDRASFPHYDLSQTKREEAIRLGAKVVTPRELVEIMRKFRSQKNDKIL